MKRNLFLKILFSYLVVVCLSFFVLDLLIKDEIKKVITAKIETELLYDMFEKNDNYTPKWKL